MLHQTDPNIPSYALDKCRRARDAQVASFQKALKAGVSIAAGTDAGTPYNPHWGSYTELCKMVEYGCTPWHALRAATIDGARMIGVEDWTGSLEVGKTADFLALDTNPLEDVGSLASVGRVYLGGRRVHLDDLQPDA